MNLPKIVLTGMARTGIFATIGALMATVPAHAADEGRVIGKLGQAVETAPIRATTSPRSRVYSTAKKFQYLVIQSSDKPGWLRVVLQNGRLGYIHAEAVARLPYDVRVKDTKPARTGGSLASRGTGGSGLVGNMLNYSFRYIGTPYKWGGESLTSGIDCSAFVQKLFGKIGVDLPRTAAEQALVGTPVERFEHLQPGDRLYFWEERRKKIGHTGIFLGFTQDGRAHFIHSSSGRKGVQTDDLTKPNWRRILVAARRDA
jgi:cell wall-associated NlpC family hydrolase